MPTNLNKRIPLNLDLEKLLLHYNETLDISEYEERAKRYAETRAKWIADNVDRVRGYKRSYNERNPAKRKSSCARYYERNKFGKIADYRTAHADELREYWKQYREEHRDARAEYQKRYRETHKEQMRAYKQQHREEHIAYMREYRKKRRCDVATDNPTV